MNVCIWSGFLTSDIGYPIKSDRRTTSDKLYITQLLPTEYSINITNGFGGYQYNKQWMSVYGVDIRPNIHLMYTGIRQISDWIFIWCMQGSGGLLTGYSFSVWHRSGRFLTKYSFGVCTGVRWISDWIFIQCIQGSGRWPTEYSVGVCRDPADHWLNIHLVYE